MPIQAPPRICLCTSDGLIAHPISYAEASRSTRTWPVSVSPSTSATMHA